MRGCNFYAVSNPWMERRMACNETPACKAFMVARIVEQALAFGGDPSRLVVVSFFDDEKPNIEAVTNMMSQFLVPVHPEICFRVYDTSNPALPAKQIDLSRVCASIAPGADWQSKLFLATTKGVHVNAF